MQGDSLIAEIEEVIEWMTETGLMDVLSDMVTDFSVEAMYAVLALVVGLISSAAAWGIAIVVAIIAAVVAFLTWLFFYIFYSVGLMRIAKKMEVKHRWMAWIPFANAYLLGACAEQGERRNGKKPWKWGLILLFVTLGTTIGQPIVQLAVSIILSVLPMLSVVINLIVKSSSLILMALNGYCMYLVFKEFMGKTGGIVMAVCAAITGRLDSIFMFIVSCLKLRPASEPVKVSEKDEVVAVVEAE